jgi:hypothetical protein
MSINIREFVTFPTFSTVLPGSGKTVEFKAINTGQLKKLLIYEGEESPVIIERILDELITSSVVSENFDIDDLYIQDRFYLLVEIRKRSKGKNYNFGYKCGKCKQESIHSIDLDRMNVKKRAAIESHPIKFNDQISFELDHIKRRDMKEVYEYVDKLKLNTKTQEQAEMITSSFAMSIKKINTPKGVLTDIPLEDKIYLIDNMTEDAFKQYDEWARKNDFGIEFKYEFQCPHCKNKETVEVPVSDFFA